MNKTLHLAKCNLCGKVNAPSSKSVAHRYLIAAGLAVGKSTIENVGESDDILATVDALCAIGVKIQKHGTSYFVEGGNYNKTAVIDCKESGSTLRFFMPICAALGIDATFIGKGKLPSRPYDELALLLEKNGASFSVKSGLPCNVKGRISGGIYGISGNVSSQFITGLLFALPLLKSVSKIDLLSPLESRDYCNLTIDALHKFGIKVSATNSSSNSHPISQKNLFPQFSYSDFGGYIIDKNSNYSPAHLRVEGDYSAATFWFCAAALNGKITVTSLCPSSLQGDRKVLEILQKIGAKISTDGESVSVSHALLNPCDIDAKDIPDAIPALCVVLSQAEGVSRIFNTSRLTLKECDRREAIINNLSALGVDIRQFNDTIIIKGGKPLRGAKVEGFGDHRIVMSMAIAASVAIGETVISDCDAVAKSYPDFWKDFKALGGIFSEI